MDEKKIERIQEDEALKQAFLDDFNKGIHRIGRCMLIVSVILLIGVPFLIGAVNGVTPSLKGFLIGFAKVGIIYIPVAIVEFLVYTPMLGAGGSYLAFITGNLTNLKIPCCMTARDIVGTKYGTKENEIISTISVAVSSLVTCTVLILGVLLLAPLTPILQSPVLQPAFNTVVPALFGALGYKYFSKTPLVAVAPFLCMTALCLLVPAAASQVAILVPVSALISIGAARLLYVKGVLQ